MKEEIKRMMYNSFDYTQEMKYHFHEAYGFTFVFKEELLTFNEIPTSLEIKPIGIIYEEKGEYYLAPLCGLDNLDEIVKEYVKKCL